MSLVIVIERERLMRYAKRRFPQAGYGSAVWLALLEWARLGEESPPKTIVFRRPRPYGKLEES